MFTHSQLNVMKIRIPVTNNHKSNASDPTIAQHTCHFLQATARTGDDAKSISS